MNKIKETKSVIMYANELGVNLTMVKENQTIFIPLKSVFQVKRGLESYVQKYYRKAKK